MRDTKKILLVLILTTLALGMIPPQLVIADPPNANDVNGVDAYLIESFDDYTKYGYDVHKVVDPFLYRSEVLCEAHLPLIYNLNLKKTIPLTEKTYINEFISKTEVNKHGFDSISYSYYILQNETYKRLVPVREKGFIHDINGSYETTNISYKQVDDYRYIWREIKSLSELSLKSGYVIIDIVGRFKAALKYQTVDVIPWVKVGSYQKQFAQFATWNTSWAYKKKITIESDFVDTPLINRTVKIHAQNDTDLFGHCLSNHADIVFVDGTESMILPFDFEYWDYDAVNSDVSFIAFVNVTRVESASDTNIYMYYGNAVASSYENETETWDFYTARWNFTNAFNTGFVNDTTGNGHNGTKNGALKPEEIDGSIYKCQQFVNSSKDEFITLDQDSIFMTVPFTVETFILIDDNTSNANFTIVSKWPTGGTTDYGWMLATDDDDIYWRQGGSSEDNTKGADCLPQNQWVFVAATENASRYVNLTCNTSFVGAYQSMKTLNTNPVEYFGKYRWGTKYYMWLDGRIDEVRFANVECNRSWLNFTFHSLNQTNTFITFGAEEQVVTGTPIITDPATNIEETTATANARRDAAVPGLWSCGFWVADEAVVTDANDDQNITVGNYDAGDSLSYGFSGLAEGHIHTIRAWARNTTLAQFNMSNANSTFLTKPDAPEDYQANNSGSTWITMEWTKGDGANRTHIVRKLGSYPTSRSDGTNVYNNTGTWYNDTLPTEDLYFYRAWSFSNWTVGSTNYSRWSDSYASLASSGLIISVYNESDLSAITDWWVFISNKEGTETYNESYCNNPHSILNASMPTGDDVMIVINATGYRTRVYYMDIESGSIQSFNAFLPPLSTPSVTILCHFYVIDELSNPVDNAKIAIKKYMDETFGYQNVTILLSDGYGVASAFLIENDMYKAVASKTGYDTAYADFIANESQTIRLYWTTGESPEYPLFWDYITFNATMNVNGSLYINYDDSNLSTIDTTIIVYEIYNGTLTHLITRNDSSDSFYFIITGINTSRMHIAYLYFNNTANFDVTQPVQIIIYPITYFTPAITFASMEAQITAWIGESPGNIGWGNIIAIVLGLIFLGAFGPLNAGLGVIMCGGVIALMKGVFAFNNVYLIALIPIFIILGIGWFIIKRGGEKL